MNVRAILGAVVGAVVTAWACAATAHTEDWRRLFQDGDFEVAVNVDSFKGPPTQREAQAVLAWVNGAPSGYMMLTVRIDCEARTISAVHVRILDQKGELVREGETPPMTEPVKESDGTAALAHAVCEGVGIEGRAFESANAFAAWVATQPDK